MKANQQLYFIAIIPPAPIFDQAKAWKEYFAEIYHSKAALKSPPHITLHMPLKLNEEKEDQLSEVLQQVANKMQPFEVALSNFGHFGQRTIFIGVEENERMHELFKILMKSMKIHFNIFNADYKNRGFNPHLTLAFRDLKKATFGKAWPEFEDKVYQAKFMAERFTLLKHNGKFWETYRHFSFLNQ